MIARRSFVAGLAAAAVAPQVGWAAAGTPRFVAGAKDAAGGDLLLGLDLEGQERFRLALPARAHAGAAHPTRPEAVVFARRPGYYALVVDAVTGKVVAELTPPEGLQFNGHGVFADGGATLLIVAQTATGSEGRIGLWDVASGYTRIGEIPTHGLGPHDIRLLPDGRTLVVANGGIVTDAEDRTKLNIPDMRPSLAYLSLAGDLLDEVRLDHALRFNSIRHLALRDDGLVAFAMQWEGEPGLGWPLLGLHRQGEAPVLAEAPLADELAMQGYAGSTAFSGDGSEIAITSPRGGRLHRFTATGDFLGAVSRTDICGLAPHPAGFMATDGFGGVIAVDKDGARPLATHALSWDNHIIAL